MPEILTQGSRGEEVRRLQVNLNAAIGRFHRRLDEDGKFGPLTREAVIFFQRNFQLKVDGIVGPQTRSALATRVVTIAGSITRDMVTPPPPPQPSPSPPPTPPQPPSPAPPTPTASRWLFQLQPAVGFTPPPFVAPSPTPNASIVSGQLLIGIVYRTATEGPHWEFGFGAQPSVNSVNSATDPRYTLQMQGSVAYADPFNRGPFHTQLTSQVFSLQNFSPSSTVVGLGLGGQVSIDIIDDKWNIFLSGQAAGFWVLHDPSGGQTGQVLFGPLLGLGTTFQWGP